MNDNETVFRMLEESLSDAEQRHPEYPTDMVYAGAIVAEEAGELTKAINDYQEGKCGDSAVIVEALHTAATAVRFLKNFDEFNMENWSEMNRRFCRVQEETAARHNGNRITRFIIPFTLVVLVVAMVLCMVF